MDRRTKHHENHCGVYVITDGTACKIGIASDGEVRLAALQIGNPRILTLHAFVRATSKAEARRAEQAVHKTLGAVRLQSEWFGVTPETAIACIRSVLDGNPDNYQSLENMTQRAMALLKKVKRR